MKVVVYGAGGPVAAAAIKAVEGEHTLRLTDLNPDMLAGYDERHEKLKCDVGDPSSVLECAEGMDAIANFTVNRPHPKFSFDVNCRGAFNVMRAAQKHGIKKVVHTGPQLVSLGHSGDYHHDWGVMDDVPPRGGLGLYGTTKQLGHEICRIFAEECDIQVITLVYASLVDPQTLEPGGDIYPFSVSWSDSGEAVRCALAAGELPHPFENFLILADMPHGKFLSEKARRLLGWQPKDNFEAQWKRTELTGSDDG